MEPRRLDQTISDMRKLIQQETATGFCTAEEIMNLAVAVYSDREDASDLRRIAERLTRQTIEAHLAAQQTWPAVTDCDLLDRAFGEMERAGIVARHNFTCCGT